MKNIAFVHCNLNKISHKEFSIWPTHNNLKKHDIQSGQSFWDGGSITFFNLQEINFQKYITKMVNFVKMAIFYMPFSDRAV